jgi:hypothetical protein
LVIVIERMKRRQTLKLTREQNELRRYLLGSLEPDVAETLETQLLENDETYQELLVAEAELVDQYIAGELTETERHGFETHLLIGADGQAQVRFARALRAYIASNQTSTHPLAENGTIGVAAPQQIVKQSSTEGYLEFLPTFITRSPLLALCTVLVIGLAIFVTYRVLQNRETAPQFSATQVVALLPGSTRGGGGTQRVKIFPNTGSVRFELEVTHSTYQTYRAELSSENGIVDSFPSLKPQTRESREVITFTVPTHLLPTGDYLLRLNGVTSSGSEEFIDSYPFRLST